MSYQHRASGLEQGYFEGYSSPRLLGYFPVYLYGENSLAQIALPRLSLQRRFPR